MNDIDAESAALRAWLMDIALPFWWERGADRISGGFHEAIDLAGHPMRLPHRARSIARQAFSYCEAGRLGWTGPWGEAAQHALQYLCKYFLNSEGLVISVVDVDGRVSDARVDLYNQAFALLAFAAAYRAFGRAPEWRDKAARLRTALYQNHRNSSGGFFDPQTDAPHAANPHMHLFEAALAWRELNDDPAWKQLADDIAQLSLHKFIDPASGALREFFDKNWSPVPGIAGQICEPGHHYEWAFLLDRWAARAGRERPSAVSMLVAFADRYGFDRARGVAMNATLSNGTIYDSVARLWAQAERVRAYLVTERAPADVLAAIRGLRRFLTTSVPGLWFDQLKPDGNFVHEPARATSLYHIIGAVDALGARIPGGQTVRAAAIRRAPRIVYLVTEDWYFISHRLPMARAARAAGFEVHVATRVDRHGEHIKAEGFRLHPVGWRRGSLNPFDLARVVREVRALYRNLKPDIAHHVALPATVVGSLAATGLPLTCLNAMTGLGTLFISDALSHRLVRSALRPALRSLLSRRRSALLVQNRDDESLMASLGVQRQQIALIPGSGVDVDEMTPAPEPGGPIAVAFVGRLVESKGIRPLVAAHARLVERGRDIHLLIAGTPDAANPSSISLEEIERWKAQRNLSYLGFVEDIPGLWRKAHIAVLPSHREGLPLSLIQAAACGRPLIATDVPGCRAIARQNVNALLVPRDNVEALAQAIDCLATDGPLRRSFGAASRKLVEEEFSSERIGAKIVALYHRLLGCAS
jgi:mannose/cellobiose epimerase-like protein (N-acyl-D-glucosamine 2-epimerase family)